MNSGVSKILKKGSALNALGAVAPLIGAFIAIPHLLEILGTERFAILALVWTLTGYVGFVDVGVSRAIVHFLGPAYESDTRPGSRVELFWSALGILFVLGVGIGLLTYLVGLYGVRGVLDLGPQLKTEAVRALPLIGISVPIVILTNALRSALEAKLSFGMVAMVRVPQGFLTFAAPLIVSVFVSTSLFPVIASLVAVRAVALVAYVMFVAIVDKGLLRPVSPTAKDVGKLCGYGGWVTVSAVLGPLMIYFDRFVIAVMLSVEAVAEYAIAQEIVSKLAFVAVAVSTTLFPLVGRLAKSRDQLPAASQVAVRVSATAVSGLLMIIVASSVILPSAWLNQSSSVALSGSIQILCLGVLANALAQTPLTILQGTGRPDLVAKCHLVELPLYFFALWGAMHIGDVRAAAVVWTVRAIGDAVLLTLVAERIMGGLRIVRVDMLRNYLKSGSALIICAAGAWILPTFWVLTLSACLIVVVVAWEFGIYFRAKAVA